MKQLITSYVVRRRLQNSEHGLNGQTLRSQVSEEEGVGSPQYANSARAHRSTCIVASALRLARIIHLFKPHFWVT